VLAGACVQTPGERRGKLSKQGLRDLVEIRRDPVRAERKAAIGGRVCICVRGFTKKRWNRG